MIPQDIWLDKGQHQARDGKGCVMEWVSVKWMMEHRGLSFTEAWALLTDAPDCTEFLVYRAAQIVNDRLPDDERQRLVPLIDRLMHARRVADPVKAKRCRVRVSCWAARSVLHLVRAQDRAVCEKAIATAEAWLRGEATEKECATAAATASTCTAAAAVATAAATAAATVATTAAATAATTAATAVATDADVSTDAAATERDSVLWLDELIDAWEKARAEEGVLWDEFVQEPGS